MSYIVPPINITQIVFSSHLNKLYKTFEGSGSVIPHQSAHCLTLPQGLTGAMPSAQNTSPTLIILIRSLLGPHRLREAFIFAMFIIKLPPLPITT